RARGSAAAGPPAGRSRPAELARELPTREADDRRPPVDVVVRELGREELVEELLHLRRRQALPRLDRALARVGHGDAPVLVARRAHELGTVRELRHHLAESAFRVEVAMGVRHRAHEEGVAAEGLHLEAGPREEAGELLDAPELGGREAEGERKEEALPLLPAPL